MAADKADQPLHHRDRHDEGGDEADGDQFRRVGAGSRDSGPDSRAANAVLRNCRTRERCHRREPEQTPLPQLVNNAYTLLGKDWLEAVKRWQEAGFPTPPVMITVANRTETAARVKHAFDHNRFHIEELCAPELTVHIDSKVLAMAEAEETELPVLAGTAK